MRRNWGAWWLVAVGAALVAAYALLVLWPMRIWSQPVSPDTNVVQTFGIDRAGALRYVLTVGLLFGLYGLALWLVLVRGVRARLGVVVGLAALSYLAVMLTHPLSSTDVFNYVSLARIQWVYGDNPLTTPPLAHPEDPFYRLIFFWRELPSPYGPLWSLIAGGPLALGGGRVALTVVLFKAAAVLCFLGAGALAALTAERLRAGSGVAAVVVLLWNPLAVWDVAGNGHNDAVMVAFLALAAYLLARGLAGPALLAFTASALVKFATLLLVPAVLVWWWRSGRQPGLRPLLPWLAGAALLVVAAYAPYWQGIDTVRASLDEGSYFAVSGPAVVRGALAHRMSVDAAELLAAWGGRLAFLAAYAALLRRRAPTAGVEWLIATGALAFVAYLVLAATFFAPWYVLWPLALAAMAPWRRQALAATAALSLAATSVLLWATWARTRFAADPLADWYPMHVLTFLSVASLTVAAWWWGHAHDARTAAGTSVDVHPPVTQREVARTGLEG